MRMSSFRRTIFTDDNGGRFIAHRNISFCTRSIIRGTTITNGGTRTNFISCIAATSCYFCIATNFNCTSIFIRRCTNGGRAIFTRSIDFTADNGNIRICTTDTCTAITISGHIDLTIRNLNGGVFTTNAYTIFYIGCCFILIFLIFISCSYRCCNCTTTNINRCIIATDTSRCRSGLILAIRPVSALCSNITTRN